MIYRKFGVPSEDADLVADSLVQADLWGHQSHGILRLSGIQNDCSWGNESGH